MILTDYVMVSYMDFFSTGIKPNGPLWVASLLYLSLILVFMNC